MAAFLVPLRRRELLQPEDRLAFLHQIEPIARHGFEINRIRLQKIYLARLPGEQGLLLGHLSLQLVDLAPALRKFFGLRQEEAHDDEHERQDEQDAQNAVQALPNCSFAPGAEIAVAWMIH